LRPRDEGPSAGGLCRRRPAAPFQRTRHGILTDVVSDQNPVLGSVTLRCATEHDLPAVADLTTAFYDEDGFAIVPRAALEARLRMFLSQPDANMTVAVTSVTPDAIIGFALSTMRLILESGLVAELQDLYVAPSYRGTGIGSALVSDAARWARDNAAATLEVVIAPNGRDVAHLDRFYASLGFVDERRRLVHLDV
jgi:aminoglycoside 6'-N-acetyltransferase I